MKNLVPPVIAAVLLSFAAAAQSPSSGADAWGEAVEGNQLRLAVAAQLATPEIPMFEVQLRNRGTSPLTFVAEALNSRSAIEIDGIWYSAAGGGSCCSFPQTVAPGSQGNVLQLRLQGRLLLELDPNGTPTSRRLSVLMPGKHSLRLRTYSNDRINVTIQSSTPHTIVLLSNTVTIETLTAQPISGQPAAR